MRLASQDNRRENIQAMRKEMGMTKIDISAQIKCSINHYSEMEKGDSRIDIIQYRAIKKFGMLGGRKN